MAEVPARSATSIRRLTDCQTATLTGIDMNTWIDNPTDSVQSGRLRRMHREAPDQAAAAEEPA